MDYTRRELQHLLPALLAAVSQPPLPSRAYEYTEMQVKKNPATHGEGRQVFSGLTHEGVPIDLHITLLPPGQMPHPPHHHVWEEMFFVQTGSLEVTIKGKSSRIGPGSVAYVASNEEHGVKNTGQTPAQYFVFTVGSH